MTPHSLVNCEEGNFKTFYKLIYYLINSCYFVLQHILQNLFNDKPKGNFKAAKMFSV